jgi:peptidase YpeB-like protein
MRLTKLAVGGSALALALGATGGTIAFASGNDDQTLGGPSADQARAAALQYTGGGKARTSAFASGNDDQTLGGPSGDRARAAALRYTGGGKAGIVEPESSDPEEGGAAYGVEVTRPDGSPVDVFLDKDYKLMRIASNADG